MKPLVLIVEDDEGFKTILEVMFRRRGYQTVSACSVTQGLQTLTEIHPDIVILDVMMPDGTGMQVLRQIRSQYVTRNLPVIMFSGMRDKQIIDECTQSGASAYIYKDQVPALIDKVQKLLGHN